MVGSLIKVGQPVALVKVDNLIYQVRVGNCLGRVRPDHASKVKQAFPCARSCRMLRANGLSGRRLYSY